MSILGLDIVQAVHFGMRTSASLMISFAYDPVFMHQHRPHHRIGRGMTQPEAGEFQTAEHVSFING